MNTIYIAFGIAFLLILTAIVLETDKSIDNRPYLLSVGFGIPLFGIWGHHYFYVKKRHKVRSVKFAGFILVWCTYKRLKEKGE